MTLVILAVSAIVGVAAFDKSVTRFHKEKK